LIDGETIPESKKKKTKSNNEFEFPATHSHQLVSLRQAALESFIG